jgi:hypothetical protein
VVLVLAGVLLIYPATTLDLIAVAMAAAVLAFQWLAKPVPTTTG